MKHDMPFAGNDAHRQLELFVVVPKWLEKAPDLAEAVSAEKHSAREESSDL
jgi:hypothetical protein